MSIVKTIFTSLFSFKRLSKDKLKVVVLCLIASTTFWFFSALNKPDYTTNLDYPITYEYNDSLFVPTDKFTDKVRIEVSGSGWDLFKRGFRRSNNPIVLTINNPERTKYILGRDLEDQIKAEIAPTALNRIYTDTIDIYLEPIITKDIQLSIDTSSILLAKNFLLKGEINIKPNTVKLRGPQSILEAIAPNYVLQLDNEKNLKANFDKEVALHDYDNARLSWEQNTVNVQFEVVELLEGSQRIKLRRVNFPEGIYTDPADSSINITYNIREDDVKQLKTLTLEAILDFELIKEDSILRPKLRRKPAFLENVQFERNTFQVTN